MRMFLKLSFNFGLNLVFFVLFSFSLVKADTCVSQSGQWCIQDDGGVISYCHSTKEECINSLTAGGECIPGAETFNYTKCYKLNQNHTVGGVYDTPGTIVNTIVNNLMIAGGLVLFAMIVYSGFLMINGGSKGFEEARGILGKALIGLVVMVVAYWVVLIIGKLTGMEIFGVNGS